MPDINRRRFLLASAGAAGLAAFLVAATWVFHTGPDQRIQLLKNIAILGGLLNLIAQGPGGISLEGGGKA